MRCPESGLSDRKGQADVRERARAQNMLQILWKRALEKHRFPGNGMGKSQGIRVQRLAGTVPVSRIIEKITQQGMADMLHMDADLMGAARVQLELYKGCAAGGSQYPVMRDGGFPGGICPAFQNGMGAAADGNVNGSQLLGEASLYKGQISAGNPMFLHGF